MDVNQPDDTSDNDRKQRIEALLNVSKSANPPTKLIEAASHRNDMSSHSRTIRTPRALMAIGLTILAFAIVAAGVIISRSVAPSQTHAASKPLVIVPFSDGLDCARDAAWSPSGGEIALVGYAPTANQTNCPSSYGVYGDTISGIVSVYQTSNGRLLDQYHPDTVIKPLLTVPKAVLAAIASVTNGGTQTPTPYTADYTHLLWSPDGSRLYLTWLVILPTGLPPANASPAAYSWPSVYASGIVVINIQNGLIRAMSSALSASPYHAVGWDLTTGKINPSFQQPANPSRFATQTPAQSYQWTSTGSLLPVQSLPTAQTASMPAQPTSLAIGAPQGGSSFSAWQPGIIEQNIDNDLDGTTLVNMLAFATDIAAISPNGRFLVEGLSLEAVTISSSSEVQQMKSYASQGLGALPLSPARDRALATLEALPLNQYLNTYTLSRTLDFIPVSGVYVAWSPNGRYLAAIYSQPTPMTIIYNCQTGAVAAKLTQLSGAATLTDDSAPKLIRWSPDGTHLLSLDPSVGAMTIWGPGQLPH